jgi:hypothetical protein
MSKNKSITVYFPNTPSDNPMWEYDNVTGYVPAVTITKEEFIRNNNLGKTHNFSQKQDNALSGRASGIKRKHKSYRNRHKRTNTRKRK